MEADTEIDKVLVLFDYVRTMFGDLRTVHDSELQGVQLLNFDMSIFHFSDN